MKLLDIILAIFRLLKKPDSEPFQPDISCNFEKLKEFLGHLIPFCREKGYNIWSILTQAWHESGAFKHVIGNWNLWGIKKPKKWSGKICKVLTTEFVHGKRKKFTLEFADWPTASDALAWYDSLVRRLYKSAYKNRNNPDKFFEGLISGKYKWATDPRYVQKLKRVYMKLQNSNIFEFVEKMI